MDDITGIVERLVEAWNSHDVEQVMALYAPEYQEEDVGQPAPSRGLESVRRSVRRYLTAFPDMQLTLDDVLVQGNRAAFLWTLTGTHRGGLMNIPPSGRPVRVRGTTLLTVEAGKITRNVRIWDMAGMLRAIGLLPDL
jgi:steroid delta-isomerase-like uncharacterized protein